MTARRLLFAGFFLVFAGSAHAQIRTLIDSLERKLPTAQGKQRFEVLNALAWEFRFAHPDSTIYYAQQAYDLGRSLELTYDLARPLNYLGVAHNYLGNRMEAIAYHEQAIQIAIAQDDSSSIAHANNSIGRVYFEQGMVEKSIDYYLQAEEIFEKIKDLNGLAYAFQSLGNLYRSQNDFAKAQNYYERALTIRKKLPNQRNIMAAMVLLGRLYQDQNQLEKSNASLQEALRIGNAIDDRIQVAEIYIFLSQNSLHVKELAKAEKYALDAYREVSKLNNVRMMPWLCNTLGQVYLAQNKIKESTDYFNLALKAAIEIKEAVSQRDAYHGLWKIAEKRGDKMNALHFQNQFLIMRDSTSSQELARQVDNLQFQLEMEKRNQENELLKAADQRNEAVIKQQRLQNLILVIVVGAVALLLVVQWLNMKKRRAASDLLALQNEQISLRNQQLSDLNNEKDTLMNIMVHDLKAPINNIKGLTTLLELDGKLSPDQYEYVQLIKSSSQSSLEMITDLLDVNAIESGSQLTVEPIQLKEFLTKRLHAFAETAGIKNITVNVQVEDVHLHSDKEYLSRIMDNLVSNAIKFSPQGTTVTIKAFEKNGYVHLSVKDQGLGFSEADKKGLFQKFKKLSARPTGGESSNGLGLAIVKILIDRLGGSIELNSAQGQGSEFVVSLPFQYSKNN